MSQTTVFEFAQKFEPRPLNSINNVIPLSTSKRTAYRHIQRLKKLGFITKSGQGYFMTNNIAVSQSEVIRDKLLPSFKALKLAKRFGRRYNNLDINFVNQNENKNIQSKFITLDYKAWELTKYQSPSELYMYVDRENFDKTISYLKENKFSEGKRGRIVILPMIGDFSNEIERVYLDCIAKGGRSIQDAIAIELLHGDRLSFRGNFPVESVLKVREDLPYLE